jgi:hypothetical protein
VGVWEYKKVALNQVSARAADIDLLNDAGDEGWELISILPNNIAYLKREIDAGDVDAAEDDRAAQSTAPRNGTAASTERPRMLSADRFEEVRSEVKPKYRDPVTGDTWSGRGRMATWLKRKQDGGEDIEKYLV